MYNQQYACTLDESPNRPFAKQLTKQRGVVKDMPIDDRPAVSSGAAAAFGRGGWNAPDSQAELSPYYTSQCDIDRRDVAKLSPQQFVEQYARQGEWSTSAQQARHSHANHKESRSSFSAPTPPAVAPAFVVG